MKSRPHHIAVVLAALLFALNSCSPSKFIPESETLYRGSSIELVGPETTIKKDRLADEIATNLYPKANKKFLGLFYTNIWLYEKVNVKEKKERSLKHWLKYKIGEPPVFTSSVDTILMNRIIEKKMQDNGFFHASSQSEVRTRKQVSKVHYTVGHGEPARIDTFRLPKGNTEVEQMARSWRRYKVKTGDIYALENFTSDRRMLADRIKSKGYFDFDEKSIIYLIDTSRADGNLAVDLRIKPPAGDSLHRKYYIDDVNVFTTYEPDDVSDSITYRRQIDYKGYKIFQNYEYLGRKAVNSILLIEPGTPFSVKDYNYTLNRLIGADVFRHVNIVYNKQGLDSLDVNIYLTPSKYQNVKFDVEATTSNRSFLGSSFSISYSNKNLFRGAENFTLRASAGTEFQFINDKAALNILNVNLEARLDVPGIITFFKTRKVDSEVMPRTYISLEENFQKWLQYYTLNSMKFGAGYNWQKDIFNHHLEPLSFEWITLINKTDEFDDLLSENPLLKRSFRTSMIFGQSYNLSINTKRKEGQRSYIYYIGGVDLSGNLGYAVGKIAKPDKEGPYRIFGVQFANYFKMDQEIRHTWAPTSKMSLVSRFNVGLGVAYGNSTVMPYVKQFFVGGPNTIRAFKFRSLGPGTYSPDAGAETNPIEQSGDIKVLMNLEYRFTMYRFLKAAVFADAGNVWLRKEDPDRPGGKFELGSFYKQLALGTGMGIRLDFDFFALRVDLGIPVYIPYNDDGERWIHQFPESSFKEWRKANWAWNIAIGYPF